MAPSPEITPVSFPARPGRKLPLLGMLERRGQKRQQAESQQLIILRREMELAEFRSLPASEQVGRMLELADSIRRELEYSGKKHFTNEIARKFLMTKAKCRVDYVTYELADSDCQTAVDVRLCHERLDMEDGVEHGTYSLTSRDDFGFFSNGTKVSWSLSPSLVADQYQERRVKYMTILEVLAEQVIPTKYLLIGVPGAGQPPTETV